MLDLLLAARDSLYLSHTGRSVRDNSPLPPSVLVAELLDILVPAIAADPASPSSLAPARQRLVVEHPLQPFSRAGLRPSTATRACAATTANWPRRCGTASARRARQRPPMPRTAPTMRRRR